MKVKKNINNNVSLCLDSRNKEVVVFGKGVGFIKPLAEIPLAKIERTFYNLNERYIELLNEIPTEVIDFTSAELEKIQGDLPYDLNSNLIMTLADHISFALEREKKGINIPMPSVYELEIEYPLEVKIGRVFLSDIEKRFGRRLPSGEVQGIAMHFINARKGEIPDDDRSVETQFEVILDETTGIIENEMKVTVDRNTFNFARFASHLKFLLKRVFEMKPIDSENIKMYEAMKNECEEVSACVNKIGDYLNERWGLRLSEEEKLYLILHVNRVCAKQI